MKHRFQIVNASEPERVTVIKHYRRKPAQANCRRCGELFVYFHLTKRRIYCQPCVPLEAKDANAFFNAINNPINNRLRAEARRA